MPLLQQLHLDIDSRVSSIRREQPDWLCGKGCDQCCRRLAAMPQLTPAEWRLLREGLDAMPAERLALVRQRLAQWADAPARPITCPLLDQDSGACPVYAQRPVACRTYGFYAQRDKGLYCGDIEAQAEAGQLDHVVWGNHDAVDQQLAKLGQARPLNAWFAAWDAGELP